ncbi:MAG: Autotransporter adhesin [Labilithrix sp.]|nr:Autotransporter adhesin [Labilithrix sp.]
MTSETGFDTCTMRVRNLLAVLPFFATACTFLFPLDDVIPDEADAADAAGTQGDAASDAPGARLPYPAAVLDDAPVLYLRLGEKSGPTARDETERRSPTYGGQVTYSAKGAIANDPDTAATFTGSGTSTVSIPEGLDFPGTAAFSVEVWARQTTRNQFGWAVDHQVYGNRNGWSLRFGDKVIGFERWVDNEVSGVTWPNALQVDTYQHIVGTFDGAVAVLYVDGKEAQRAPSSLAMKPMKTSWSAGSQNCACGSSDFIGSLDELAVYDHVLSAARVLAHYHASGR